jgi:hypothetical protein
MPHLIGDGCVLLIAFVNYHHGHKLSWDNLCCYFFHFCTLNNLTVAHVNMIMDYFVVSFSFLEV